MKHKYLPLLILSITLTIIICAVHAQEETTEKTTGLNYICAGISVGMSCIGASYAVAKTGTAMIGALTEKPELFGKMIAVVGLSEGIAIYGLLIAILVI